MRTVARCSGASVVGITISPYQIRRARRHNEQLGLTRLCELVEGDFNAMPFAEATFDAAYTLEACCHAADRRGPFAEVFRVLKPGALFAGHDWCMTPRYRRLDPEHDRIKRGIEKGNGVADLVPSSELDRALSDVGFETLQTGDSADGGDPAAPWYLPLAAGASLRGFRNSRAGGFLTHQMVRILEAVGASPKGTVDVHDVLRLAQRALVEGGQTGIYTPMYAWLARKPASASP
jgi:SAM-dependent methyltransferase